MSSPDGTAATIGEGKHGAGDAGPAVEVAGVSHRYGKTAALADATLTFPAGSSTAIIGPDGVGKSTLLGLISGVRRLQAGSIAVFGGSMADRAHRDVVANRIAYMPQGLGRNLYPTLSVTENIDFHGRLFGLGTAEREARIARLLAATGLDPFPHRPAGKLSGGMKQKLSLCCALVHDPDLLVLDEPTTGVDPLSRRQFWELIAAIRTDRPGMTVLVATAYMDEAARFERIVAMDDGRVIADGALADILAKTGTRTLEEAYVALQAAGAGEGAAPGAFTIPPLVADDHDIAIAAEGLTRRFGDFTAVDHVSFRIARGEIFGFLGSNGCGKTTTMKMLTGLLPATEGSAELLGTPVDAGDMAVRMRVGYMSQSFSLYEELTVRDNLVLHARLYRVEEPRVHGRVGEAMQRFELAAHADEYPSSLPLGIRQRLQLAAALLHEPEVLILDEPTSGVDPAARDGFWRHLARLSREDKVTIFVSTHFMNEAERCDRISLMHQGRVLVVGTPAEIVAGRGAEDLEAAFIAHLEEAGADKAEAPSPTAIAAAAPEVGGSRAAHRHLPKIHLSRLGPLGRVWAFARREALEIMRDKVRLAFAVAGPLVLLLAFGFGISFDVEKLPFAAYDRDQSIESRVLIDAFAGSRYFVEQPPARSDAEADRRLIDGELRLVIGVPPEFGRDLLLGRRPEVSFWVDGANTYRGETTRSYISGVISNYVADLAGRELGPGSVQLATVGLEPRFAYNQAFLSVNAIAPGVIMLLLVLVPAMMTALGVVREREIGSIANLEASPATVPEFLIGKQIPYVVIGFFSYATLVATAVFFFRVPLTGSLVALSIGAALYVLATTAFGLLISTMVRSQVAAIFATAIVTIIPAINFSGFLYPVSSIEGAPRIVGQFFPAAWFQTICLGTFAKGLGPTDFIGPYLALGAFGLVFIAIACVGLRKQEP